jgi:hypothetical protein
VLYVLLRAGLLAAMISFVFADLLLHLPLSLNLSAWYAPWSLAVLAIPLALAIYGFYTSLGGNAIFSDVLAEE